MGCGRPLCRRDNGPSSGNPGRPTGQVCAAQVEVRPHNAEWSPGRASHHQISPIKVRTTAYHDGSGPDSRSDAHSAIIVGGWEKQSGESRSRASLRLRQLVGCSGVTANRRQSAAGRRRSQSAVVHRRRRNKAISPRSVRSKISTASSTARASALLRALTSPNTRIGPLLRAARSGTGGKSDTAEEKIRIGYST